VRPGIAAAAALISCVALAGCSQPGPAPSGARMGAGSGASSGLVPLEVPPASPPSARLIGVSGAEPGLILATRWPDFAGTVTESPPAEPVRWPLPLRRGASERLLIQIASAAMPARVEVRTFATVDPQTGTPSDSPDGQQCETLVSTGTPCAAVRAHGGITVHLPATLSTYLVLYVEWYVPQQDRPTGQPGVDSRAVSYGFRVG
jgi:hypothetical protein